LGNVTANVTVSVGISGTELITKGPFDYLLDSSDRALYIAKHGGRNRVVIYSPETGAAATQQ